MFVPCSPLDITQKVDGHLFNPFGGRNYSCVVSSPIGNSFHVHSLIPSVLQYWMTPWEDAPIPKHKNDTDGYKWSHLDPSPWNPVFRWDPWTFAILSSIHKSTNLKPPEICCLFCWVHSVKVQQRTSWLTAVKLCLAHTSEIHYPTKQWWKADVIDSCQQYQQNIGRGQSREWPWQSFQCAAMLWHPCCAKRGLLERTYLSHLKSKASTDCEVGVLPIQHWPFIGEHKLSNYKQFM